MKKYYLLFVLAVLVSGNYLIAQKETSNNPPVAGKAREMNNNGSPVNATKTVQVQLLFFKAEISNDVSKLHWVTEDERRLKSFTIERSTNSRDFYPIAIMPAMNEDGQLVYKYADSAISKLPAPAVFYRLKIADETDAFSYSPVASPTAGSANNSPNAAKAISKLK